MKNVSTEDYLSVIYKNRNESGEIKPNVIADKLSISNAAVTDMVKKLSKEGLINYTPYKGISLTEEGNSYAKTLVRRHRIWELFLFQIVGLPWEKVHDEAEKLEHCASDELINRMEEMLNFPEFDPHGDPIPDKNGRIPVSPSQFPLTLAGKGAVVSVLRVNDSDNSFLAHISNLGIDLKSEIFVKEVINYDGSMVAECNGNTFTISQKTASNIFVESLSEKRSNTL
ncbi:MAG: Transcriptional regulator MntR [Ignavibacteriaceae bacterium]|nr:Transcriptional regulator MntR [Ignavibacteriaceae bacterium]